MIITRRRFGAMCLAAAGTVGAPAVVRAQGAPRQLVMGSPMPSRHSASTFMVAAADAIRKESNGAIDILFLADSQLGSEADMQRQLRAGGIHFLVASCSSLQNLTAVAGMPGVAYAFKDYGQLWAAIDGDLGALIKDALGKLGMTAFKCLDNGFRNVTTSTRAVSSVGDLQGLKIRVPPSPLLTSLFQSLGASPTTISIGELYSALQTRIADGMENSLVQFDALKIYEVQQYCALTRHSWDGLWVMSNTRAWDAMPGEQRDLITRHFDAAVLSQHDDFAKQDIALKAELGAKHLRFNDVDRAQFVQALDRANYYRDWKAKFGPEAWAKLEKYTGPLGS
ncbi:TRAP transporter substrate-binding protein [Bradyrhizobium prioriisuperbiae]|uniref:TRAP transporter substrate-binding protein n=1 Tax=Bradyrhizobium prioriisuperbiae TaxID=2854389 RepID=UPI0028ECFA89|nr:TRAP transporter substrate-binding protein [Bradyrhizobium prioritasuperba]